MELPPAPRFILCFIKYWPSLHKSLVVILTLKEWITSSCFSHQNTSNKLVVSHFSIFIPLAWRINNLQFPTRKRVKIYYKKRLNLPISASSFSNTTPCCNIYYGEIEIMMKYCAPVSTVYVCSIHVCLHM